MKTNHKIFILFFCLSTVVFAQDTLLITKNYIPNTDTSLIYLPDDYSENDLCPLVILLHGWSGNYEQWGRIIDLQKFADKYDFVIATPDGFYDSWYVNSPVLKNSQIEKFMIDDLLPTLESKYKINKSYIFISGLSMGGHGAIILFLKYPDIFKSAGSTSGVLDITQFPDNWALNKVLGEYETHKKSWENNSAFILLTKDEKRPFIIDAGTEDFVFGGNKKFMEKCNELQLKLTSVFRPGKHEHQYWKESIPLHFEFFKKLCK